MREFLIRILINALAIFITAILIPGIHVDDGLGALFIVGLVLTIVNALIKPVLMLLSCPFVILTLGLFIFVVNGLLLQIAAYFSGGRFVIDGFWPAFLGGIVLAIVNMVLEGMFAGNQKAKRK